MTALHALQEEWNTRIQGPTELKRFLTVLLDFGEAMTLCGAEIYRVEDSMQRIGTAYGAAATHVFAITSNILLTVELPDGRVATQSRRFRSSGGNHFARLNELNELSREYCADPFPVEELADRLHAITARQPHPAELLLGSILVAGSFAVFFGGSVQDALLAALGGILVWLLQWRFAPLCMNETVFTFLASFLMSLLVNAVARIWPIYHIDQVMIGDIMLLIPGSMTTNAIRDFLLGDTLSGAMRLIQALLLAGVLALGVISAVAILRWM